MTPERAAILLPVISAFANGETIQRRTDRTCEWESIKSPEWSNQYEYRVKPKGHSIEWAVTQLLSGSMVKRRHWQNFLFMDEQGRMMFSFENIAPNTPKNVVPWNPIASDLTQADWETYWDPN